MDAVETKESRVNFDIHLNLDNKVFLPALVTLLAIAIPLTIYQEDARSIVNMAFEFTTTRLGWAFDLFSLFALGTLIYIATSRYGSIKLGGREDNPEYSTYSWAAMLFSGGIGSGIMIWSIMEPIYYIQGPPLEVQAFSNRAYEWASMLPLFHWGVSAWSLYALGVPAIAYILFVRKVRCLRISEAVRGTLGPRVDGWLGTAIDVIMIFGIVGGIASSMGVATPMVSHAVSGWLKIEETLGLKVVVMSAWTLLFGFSVWRGLKRGIKLLSDINMILAFVLFAFIFLCGPTLWIIDNMTTSLGLLLDNFWRISLYTDPVAKSGWPQSWTVFYWSWWLAYLPMMSMFIARISRGRTLRQVIVGTLGFGTLGCWLFLGINGNYALWLQQSGTMDVAVILKAQGPEALCLAVMSQLPLGHLSSILFVLLCFIFVATTLDTTAYILASMTARDLAPSEEPTRGARFVWAILLAVVAVSLLAVNALRAAQLSAVVSAVPMIPVGILLVLSFFKYVRDDFPNEFGKQRNLCLKQPAANKADVKDKVILF